MSDLATQLAELTRRVQVLEDERAIHQHLTGYGFAVDRGDADATAALFAEDSVSDVGGFSCAAGRRCGTWCSARSPGDAPNRAHAGPLYGGGGQGIAPSRPAIRASTSGAKARSPSIG
jgi:hypothetical protein